MRVYLCQFNFPFEGEFLPYSVASLQAFAQADPRIRKVEFVEFLFKREPLQNNINSIVRPDVVACSIYVWNRAYTYQFMSSIKDRFPSCLVIVGGPSVPKDAKILFDNCHGVDVAVHGEGEEIFSKILRAMLSEGSNNFSSIPGISFRDKNGVICTTPNHQSQTDLSSFPSPYLAGLFDPIVKQEKSIFVCQETNRGCLYGCTFCYWGSSGKSSLRLFPIERVLKELEYFASIHTDILFNCDANFGIMQRDLEIARVLEVIHRKTGYPCGFRPAYAKKTNETVVEIARLLRTSRLEKGITISIQSVSAKVLDAVNRYNIDLVEFRDRVHTLHAIGVSTYTELILGLPEETLETFKDGICALLNCGQHSGLVVHICMMLPNTEMANVEYRQKYDIKTRSVKFRPGYSRPQVDNIDESVDIVVSTASMPHNAWKSAFLFAWTVQVFHCLGITQLVARFLHDNQGLSFSCFYEKLLVYMEEAPNSVLGRSRSTVCEFLDTYLSGGAPTVYREDFAQLEWPIEEATFLELVTQKRMLYNNLREFLAHLYKNEEIQSSPALIDELILVQSAALITPNEDAQISVPVQYNWSGLWCDFDQNISDDKMQVEIPPRIDRINSLCLEGDKCSSLEMYALDILRYGRKRGIILRRPKKLIK